VDGARAFETPHIAIADELGAAFLCADLGITSEPRADHAQYLDHWLGVMKADKKAIFAGASKASEAAAFLAALQSGCVSTVPVQQVADVRPHAVC
jgi:antirestriction protein ArdC